MLGDGLHHPIMSKLWDIGGRTKRKRKNVINLDTTEGKKQEKSKTMNVIAVDNLTMTFTSK